MVTAILIIIAINTAILAYAVFFKERKRTAQKMSEDEKRAAEDAEKRERAFDNMMNYSGGPKR